MKINDEETSIYVETEIDSIEIQKYLFSHGYHWLDHHNNPHQKIIVCPLNVIFDSYTIYFNGVYSEPVLVTDKKIMFSTDAEIVNSINSKSFFSRKLKLERILNVNR